MNNLKAVLDGRAERTGKLKASELYEVTDKHLFIVV